MKKLRVGVIFGGRSGEHEVSLKSAQSVIHSLDPSRYTVIPIGITKSGCWISGPGTMNQLIAAADPRLLGPGIGDPFEQTHQDNSSGTMIPRDSDFRELDIIFPVLHGPFGEDGTVQGLLDLIQIPYVGCGVLASSVGMDKILFKQVMMAENIPVAPYLSVLRNSMGTEMDAILDASERILEWPVFCKPANMGSSVGISKCSSRDDLRTGLETAAKYDRRILLEKGVPNAREIEISVLGNDQPEASVAGEIIPSREFYDYSSKYIDNGETASDLIIPAPLTPDQNRICRDIAVKAFQAVDGAGMARVDFLLDNKTGDIFLNEINTIPGFTSISMYAKLWQASGLDYPALLDRLIELAIERFNDRKRNQVTFNEI